MLRFERSYCDHCHMNWVNTWSPTPGRSGRRGQEMQPEARVCTLWPWTLRTRCRSDGVYSRVSSRYERTSNGWSKNHCTTKLIILDYISSSDRDPWAHTNTNKQVTRDKEQPFCPEAGTPISKWKRNEGNRKSLLEYYSNGSRLIASGENTCQHPHRSL